MFHVFAVESALFCVLNSSLLMLSANRLGGNTAAAAEAQQCVGKSKQQLGHGRRMICIDSLPRGTIMGRN